MRLLGRREGGLATPGGLYDAEKFHPLAVCAGDPLNAPSRELCERHGGAWDRPCERDADCPFYQANPRYPNRRGGCLPSGYCEMPVGVDRVGYRHYDARTRPLCHCPAAPDPAPLRPLGGTVGAAVLGPSAGCECGPGNDDVAFALDGFDPLRR